MMRDKEKNMLNQKMRLIFLGLFFAGVVGVYFMIPSAPPPHVHAKLSDIKLSQIEFDSLGTTQDTLEDIKKKEHLLMVLFTLNCEDTRVNIEGLNALHQSDDIAVVGYMYTGDRKAKEYAQKFGVKFPLAKISKEHAQAFEPNVLPMAYLVRMEDLRIREKYVGIIFPSQVIGMARGI